VLKVTVGISALWDLEVQSLDHTMSVERRLELRNVPRIFKKKTSVRADNVIEGTNRVALLDTYRSSLQSWLYSAAVEISQSGSTPTWSKDTWSFLPLDFGDIREALSSVELDTVSIPGYVQNITFETQGLRARLDCRALDYPQDTTSWLKHIDFTNRTIDPAMNQSVWNATNSPSDLEHGYTLTGMANRGPRSGYYTCCANETDGTPGDTAIGYWTNLLWTKELSDEIEADNSRAYGVGEASFPGRGLSMTAKLIVGRTLEKLYQPNHPSENYSPPLYVWIEQPKFVLVNCTPVIEHANVSVTAELETGVVHDYKVLGTPQNPPEAWIDNYLTHDTSSDYAEGWTLIPGVPGKHFNLTTYENLTVR
jgi:hypothetical protein